MHRRRFYLSSPPLNSEAMLDGAEAHHLIHVLRAEVGDPIEVFNGSGEIWKGEILQIEPGVVRLSQLQLVGEEVSSVHRVILIQSMCKSDKLEWILQKATELGIAEIHLLEAERSMVKIPAQRYPNRMERWNRIIMSAAKQSLRSVLPGLFSPLPCPALCQQVQADTKLLLSENETQNKLKKVLRERSTGIIAVAVGPEGGWSHAEEALFRQNGFQPVSLGPAILRTETAAISILAVLNYELEQW
jgi:16S rRNA (uracil1498-N3)-methyltransferase